MNGSATLTAEDKIYLLRLARTSIERAANRQPPPKIEMDTLSPLLCAEGASFVTLTENGDLRGCIGALEAYQSLVEDVREHAAAAAMEDYRFGPVRPAEVAHLHIEISRLTAPQALEYSGPDELVQKLRPGLDGVVLRDGMRRSTFLPQVWEKIPAVEDFLDQLCYKMGAPASLWRRKTLTVLTYQVEEFQE